MFYSSYSIGQPLCFPSIDLNGCPGHKLKAHNAIAEWKVIYVINQQVVGKCQQFYNYYKVHFLLTSKIDYQWRTNEGEVCTSLFTHSRCCLTFRNCTLSQILHRNLDFPELQWAVLLICSLVYLDLFKSSNSSMLYLLLVLKISDGFKQFKKIILFLISFFLEVLCESNYK